jgi:hypothetical protein
VPCYWRPACSQSSEGSTVTDAVGVTWRTGDIYETSVLLTIYGMGFIALLALLRIAQRRVTAATSAATEPAGRADLGPPIRIARWESGG